MITLSHKRRCLPYCRYSWKRFWSGFTAAQYKMCRAATQNKEQTILKENVLKRLQISCKLAKNHLFANNR